MDELPQSCRVVAWRPAVAGIAEVFHARIAGYRYPTHCHETWTVLIVDDGAIRYDLDTRHHGAVPSLVTVLPPGVAHNGYPAADSFRKRCLYLDASFLPASLVDRSVDAPAFRDRELRAAVSALHDRLAGPPDFDGVDALNFEARLAMIAERFRRHLERRPAAEPAEGEPTLAARLRAYLDDRITETVTLGEAATLFDRSVPHLVRSFRRRYQISPHAYVVGARIEVARRLLLAGESPARVAVTAGFHDQSHLNRHFKRHVSVTPARYAASLRHPLAVTWAAD